MTLEFRVATPADYEAVEALLRSAFASYVRKLGRTDGPGPYGWVAAAIDRGDVFIATEDGTPVGAVTASLRGADFAIDHIAVEPSRQGQGIGSWLLDRAESAARSRGATVISLYTAEIMGDLLRLYGQKGFTEIRRAPPPHGKDPVLRVFMTKPL